MCFAQNMDTKYECECVVTKFIVSQLAQRVYYKYDQESFERKIQMCHMM